eukprot:8561215-Pyramimonas_sp.AAC.1
MELKDIVKQFDFYDRATGSTAGSTPEGTTVMVTIGAKDPNFWVQVGRLIGITLAIVEAGRLAASFLVSREVKHSVKHFHLVRTNAYRRIEARNLWEGQNSALSTAQRKPECGTNPT